MNESSILEVLNKSFKANPKYLTNNLYVFGWESDYLAMTKAGFWSEVEVKISRSDFLADFKKTKKHDILSGRENGLRPNYFAYCVPTGLIAVEEVPKYAGLYYISPNSTYITCAKATPQLHYDKIADEQLNLLDKFYYNYKSMFDRDKNHKRTILGMQNQISVLKAEFKAITGYDIKEVI